MVSWIAPPAFKTFAELLLCYIQLILGSSPPQPAIGTRIASFAPQANGELQPLLDLSEVLTLTGLQSATETAKKLAENAFEIVELNKLHVKPGRASKVFCILFHGKDTYTILLLCMLKVFTAVDLIITLGVIVSVDGL